ncbi:glucosidase II beta subunit-like-domain-containing protein [Gongronella butleri]|nr:glucosidase II beta subunit-like-domain-containing protein [Gongronella butleri]
MQISSWLTFSCLLVASHLVEARVRGVAPEKQHLYKPNSQQQWQCLDGSRTIDWAGVNDDYCDCPDGSDEPGTSACGNSYFYCENKGHLPAYIKSWSVNDGVCDEACCDGSDEASGVCANRCKAQAAVYAKELKEKQRLVSEGYAIKSTWIKEANAKIEQWQLEKTKYEDELILKRAELERFEREVSLLEQEEKGASTSPSGERRVKKASSKGSAAQREHIEKLQQDVQQLREQVNRLVSILHDLKLNHNHNFHDMAVKAAIAGYDEFLPEYDELEEQLDQEDVPEFEEEEEVVEEEDDAAQAPESEALQKAREQRDVVQGAIRDLDSKVNDVNSKLTTDYGTDNEWLSLKDTCVEKDDGEYVYSLCILGRANQRSHKDNSNVHLGNFEGFVGGDGADAYLAHAHTHGARCWNGPERSVKAVFECGSTTEILDVMEPEKCEYRFRMRSPAVCPSPESLAQQHKQAHAGPGHTHEEL